MMLTFTRLILPFILISQFITFSNGQDRAWVTHFGNEKQNYTSDALVLDDGSQLVLATNFETSDQITIQLHRVSNQGGVLWSKSLSTANKTAFDMVRADSSHVFIVGNYRYDDYHFTPILMKVSLSGEVVEDWVYNDFGSYLSIERRENGNFIIGGFNEPDGRDVKGLITEIDLNGNSQWEISTDFDKDHRIHKVMADSENNMYAIGTYQVNGVASDSLFILKYDETNTLIWSEVNQIGHLDITSRHTFDYYRFGAAFDKNENIVFCGQFDTFRENKMLLMKFDKSNGTLYHSKIIGNPNKEYIPRNIAIDKSDNVIVTGGEYTDDESTRLFWGKIDSLGELIYLSTFGEHTNELGSVVNIYHDSIYYLSGNAAQKNEFNTNILTAKLNSSGEIYNQNIHCQVLLDQDQNCVVSPDDQPLEGWLVIFKKQIPTAVFNGNSPNDGPSLPDTIIFKEEILFDYTDSNGIIELNAGSLEYFVEVQSPDPVWNICENNIHIEVDTSRDTFQLHFLIQPIEDCPLLEVGISGDEFVRCDTLTHFLSYRNKSISPTQDAFIEVTFDRHIEFISASEDYLYANNTLSIDLGELDAQEKGCVVLKSFLPCNAPLLETHCITAEIFPNDICWEDDHPDWSGAELSVKGDCDGQDAVFTISNLGAGNMKQYQEVRIYENGALVRKDSVKLDQSGSIDITHPAIGRTVRLEVDQVSGVKGISRPFYAMEGCINGNNGFRSRGYYNYYHHNDFNPSKYSLCLENRSSPRESYIASVDNTFGRYHLIERDMPMKFQAKITNTTTKPVKKIGLHLLTPEIIDLNSFKILSSSHSYSMNKNEIYGININFDSLSLLPVTSGDSNHSVFFTFTLKSKEEMIDPSGFYVNDADLYFDEKYIENIKGGFFNIWKQINYPQQVAPNTEGTDIEQFGFSSIDFSSQIIEVDNETLFYIGAGNLSGEHFDLHLVKTDREGKGIWQKTYDINHGGEVLQDGVVTADSALLLGGYYTDPEAESNYLKDNSALLMKIDMDGNKIWHKFLKPGNASDGNGASIRDILQDDNGNIYVIGFTKNTTGTDPFVMKLDNQGDPLWLHNYDGSRIGFGALSGIIDADGHVLVFATGDDQEPMFSSTDYLLMKLDPNGNQIWLKTYDSDYGRPVMFGVTQTYDGNYLVSGMKSEKDSTGNQDYGLYLQTLHKDGYLLSTRLSQSLPEGYYNKVVNDENGHYVVSGFYRITNSIHDKIFLARVREDGSLIKLAKYYVGSRANDWGLNIGASNRVYVIGQSQASDITYDLQGLLIIEDLDSLTTSTPNVVRGPETGHFTIFPNPANEYIKIQTEGVDLPAIIRMVSSEGKVILQRRLNQPTWQLDTSELASGWYVIQLIGKDQVLQNKFLKF